MFWSCIGWGARWPRASTETPSLKSSVSTNFEKLLVISFRKPRVPSWYFQRCVSGGIAASPSKAHAHGAEDKKVAADLMLQEISSIAAPAPPQAYKDQKPKMPQRRDYSNILFDGPPPQMKQFVTRQNRERQGSRPARRACAQDRLAASMLAGELTELRLMAPAELSVGRFLCVDMS